MNRRLYITFFLLCFLANVKAQNYYTDSVNVSYSFTNESIISIAEKIEAEHPVRFFFDVKDTLLAAKKFTGQYSQVSITNVLTDLMAETGYQVTYMPKGNFVILPEKYSVASTLTDVNLSDDIVIGDIRDRGKFQTAHLSGIISDGKTSEPITGAVVYALESEKGAVTDLQGEYHLNLSPGKHTIQYTFVGFQAQEKEIEVISSGNFNVELFEESIGINEVVITRKRPDKNVSMAQMSTIEITAKELSSIPNLMGESDLIKSITLMPGVQTVGEAAAGFNIRGGNIDQNLILVDGVPIYNTAHLFGFFSTIQSDVVSDVTLYKGNIPANYGGRISSVMDIGIKDTEIKKPALNAGIGLINARANLELPLFNNKLTIVAGARSTYSDWILKRMPDVQLRESSAGYNDVIAKMKWNINRNNALSMFVYYSSDRFNLANASKYEYGNRLGNVNYNHIFSSALSVSFLAGFSEYYIQFQNESRTEDPDARLFRSKVRNLNSKMQVTWLPFADNKLNIGVEANNTTIFSGEQEPLYESTNIPFKELENEQAIEFAVFVNDNYDITKWLSLTAGLRTSFYNTYGPKSVFQYANGISRSVDTQTDTLLFGDKENVKTYHAIEPRAALRFTVDHNSSLKVGYNHNVQYVQLLSNTSAATPTDVWKLADYYIKPITSNQFSLGYFRNFMNNTIEASVEGYYKTIKNLIDYKNGAVIIMNEHIETDIVPGNGRAYGVELYIKKNAGDLTGWFGYTYSRTVKNTISEFDEDLINDGDYYPAAYDKPHDITSSASYKLSRRWSASANFTYSTGRPVTIPEYKMEIKDRIMVRFSDRNKYRLPAYHRLDAAITYHGHIKAEQRFISSWTLSIYNLYGRNNPYSVYFTKDQPSKANNYQTYVLYQLSIVDRMIPTITYNFKF